jgi:hypothetical protein
VKIKKNRDMKISIARDFNRTVGARYPKEADYSGEEFRRRVLLPKLTEAISKNEKLEVDLDGTTGLGMGFLDEAFGGLILDEKLKYEDVTKHLVLTARRCPFYIEDVNDYLDKAHEMENH